MSTNVTLAVKPKVINHKQNQNRQNQNRVLSNLKRYWQLYLLLIPPTVLIIIFNYIPMLGIQLAFKDFNVTQGIFGGKWIGFDNFKMLFRTNKFQQIFMNTISVSSYSLFAGFPIPILLAIALNEVSNSKFRRFTQTVTYAPHFISIVVMVSMAMQILSPHGGIVNNVLVMMGRDTFNFIGDPNSFRSIYVWSGIWQSTGYSSIIYIAALTAIDPELYEAAMVDGVTKIKKIWYIDLPLLLPTAMILLILNAGHLMSVGYEKVLLLQNNVNIRTAEVISTYVYKVGLINSDYGFSTAVGLFNSVINLTLIVIVNQIARKMGDYSLW